MLTIALLLAFLTPKPQAESPETQAAAALKAMDQIAAADAAMERACIKAWIAHDKLPTRPLAALSDAANADMFARRAFVERACPGGVPR